MWLESRVSHSHNKVVMLILVENDRLGAVKKLVTAFNVVVFAHEKFPIGYEEGNNVHTYISIKLPTIHSTSRRNLKRLKCTVKED